MTDPVKLRADTDAIMKWRQAAPAGPRELVALRRDAERFRCLPTCVVAIIWKRREADFPPLDLSNDGFSLDSLRAWCDAAIERRTAKP